MSGQPETSSHQPRFAINDVVATRHPQASPLSPAKRSSQTNAGSAVLLRWNARRRQGARCQDEREHRGRGPPHQGPCGRQQQPVVRRGPPQGASACAVFAVARTGHSLLSLVAGPLQRQHAVLPDRRGAQSHITLLAAQRLRLSRSGLPSWLATALRCRHGVFSLLRSGDARGYWCPGSMQLGPGNVPACRHAHPVRSQTQSLRCLQACARALAKWLSHDTGSALQLVALLIQREEFCASPSI